MLNFGGIFRSMLFRDVLNADEKKFNGFFPLFEKWITMKTKRANIVSFLFYLCEPIS